MSLLTPSVTLKPGSGGQMPDPRTPDTRTPDTQPPDADIPVEDALAMAAGQPVLIVFADAREKKLLRLLKPGFRHCFALLPGGRAGEWICLDPQSHRLRLESWHLSPVFDPAAYYRALGHCGVWVDYPDAVPRKLRLGPMSCVEVIKRLLGIRGLAIVTPYQLYRHLQKHSAWERTPNQTGDQVGDHARNQSQNRFPPAGSERF